MISLQVFSPGAPAVIPQTYYAGLGRRVAAHLIDLLIALAIMMAAAFFMRWLRALGVWRIPTPPSGETDPLTLWQSMSTACKAAIIVCFIVTMGPFYLGLLQASAWQASIGKRLLNIYVTDTAGRRLRLGRSLARSFAKEVFNVFYLGFVSVLSMIATAKMQALHDLAAKTVVLNGRPSGIGSPEPWRFVAGFAIQFLWFVLTMLAVFRTLG
jgi:uncharacterized RDD family membrane protein YckC